MILISDSHCHLQYFNESEIQSIIDSARAAGVHRILNIATNINDAILDRSFKDIDILYSIGIHPDHATGNAEDDVRSMKHFLNNPKIVAIGEIGLDFKDLNDENKRKNQLLYFEMQLQLALDNRLPVSIHMREAGQDTMSVIRSFPGIKGVFHSFNGDIQLAEMALNTGFYISYSGMITFKNAEYLGEVVEQVPIERVLIETDSPYLAPHPKRGTRNEPGYIIHTLSHIAQIKQSDPERIANQLEQNFNDLFTTNRSSR